MGVLGAAVEAAVMLFDIPLSHFMRSWTGVIPLH